VASYKQCGAIVSDAALGLGLDVGADPFASADAMTKRMCALFNDCGKDLLHAHTWGQLKALWEFATVGGDTGNYLLPADWHEMVLQTAWDRTKRLPMGGPLSSQEWAYLRAMQMGVTITALFRMETNQLMLHPQPPPPGVLVSLEYMSTNWIVPDAKKADWINNSYNVLSDAAGGKDEATASADWCLFDEQLIKLYLRYKWKRETGFDTTTAEEDYKNVLDKTIGSVSPPPTLRIDGPRLGMPNVHLIDNLNLPITGYGS
jgi:hypothetical protein